MKAIFAETVEEFKRRAEIGVAGGRDGIGQFERVASTAWQHLAAFTSRHSERSRAVFNAFAELHARMLDIGWMGLAEHAQSYAIDAWQRGVLSADVLRKRGNMFEVRDTGKAPPVLCYDYEVVMDGRDLKRPVNYMLLAIRPPDGVEIHAWKRPYMIIDPRAGHGAGIGGFKADSQVGVALQDGHPVYFVVFRQRPEPGQTIADVTRAEAEFVREIVRRHPDSPRPIVVGNCQGGWATLLLAAANPHIVGPLVINGAPIAAWSGVIGRNPMRYSGGLLGGALLATVLADFGAGQFDGANLVINFEQMNPGRNWFRKYYDLFADIDKSAEKFLAFEEWWGGFVFLNEAEIRWIIEHIFVGNRLSRGEARLEYGRAIDLKAIRAPIIVFASHGDNITPPQQALNWIVDTYVDEQEIKIRGQRIIYIVHESIGHLGIFVSSSIAKKEHSEVISVLKRIEALAPGLYEMVIEEKTGDGMHSHFPVNFKDRRMTDILALGGDSGRSEEADFGAVARLSELAMNCYDLLARPMVRAIGTPAVAATIEAMHPLRMQRRLMSDRVPFVAGLAPIATAVKEARRPVAMDNLFRRGEALMADLVEQWFDVYRDVRDAWYELAFFGIYEAPFMRWVGQTHNYQRSLSDKDHLRYLPDVQVALNSMSLGGFPEAVIRMLILLAEARGSVRGSRLERSAYTLSNAEPFKSLGAERRAAVIRQQTLIAILDREGAIRTLPDLLPDMDGRAAAIGTVDYIVGPIEEMDECTIQTLQSFRRVLEMPPLLVFSDQPEPAVIEHRPVQSAAEVA